MTLSALGIFSAAGAGGGPVADYELISTQILSSSQPSVTFSNLGNFSTTYKHLQLRASVTSTRSAGDDNFRIQFNADSSSSYRSHRLIGTTSTVISSTLAPTDLIFAGAINAATGTTNSYSGLVIDILDFASTTKNTTIKSFGGQTSTSFLYLYSGAYFKTDAITSVVLSAESGNISAKSRLSLYGIRG
jgi:hypothetical protein